MTTKIVLRLLDADNQLLGWAEHMAIAYGDGTLRSQGLVSIVVDRRGEAACVSLHWADVNVETRIPIPSPPSTVRPGEIVPIFLRGAPMVTLGTPPVHLPPVTVGSVAVGIDAGALGMVGMR